MFEGTGYECDADGASEWTCGQGTSTIYCEGSPKPTDCSELWYPSSLDNLRLVTFEGVDYACETYGNRCVAYSGGPPPAFFSYPDVWCDSYTCSYYDPDVWFEITFDTSAYLCTKAGLGQHDCYSALNGGPSNRSQPEVYCSGPQYSLQCSNSWYPNELARYELVSSPGGDYLCEPALTGGIDDYDCGFYWGGDPALVFTGELKCTDRGYSFECDELGYPSELDGLWIGYIGPDEYVCQDSWGGTECFRYYGESPRQATGGLPDLYCNYEGYCDEYGYP